MEADVFTLVRIRAAEYRTLTEGYDQALLKAHKAGHGTPEMVEHLKMANSMAADVRKALELYHAAVAAMAAQFIMQQD